MSLADILSKRPARLEQPGPHLADYTFALTQMTRLNTVLPAGVSLHDSLAQMVKDHGLAGAHMRIANAPMEKLAYVAPALSPDDSHVAWYSGIHQPPMPGKICDARINCGTLKGEAFYHCHGAWSDSNGATAMGHLLPELSVPSEPVHIVGFGFHDARFNRVYDPETNFELFVPEQLHPAPKNPNAVLLRINPNVEIEGPLIECCQRLGWSRASVHGVGSVIGAHFADGQIMNSFATEAFVESGIVDLTEPEPQITLDISLVGLDGKFMNGRLVKSGNPVMITFELVLIKQDVQPMDRFTIRQLES